MEVGFPFGARDENPTEAADRKRTVVLVTCLLLGAIFATTVVVDVGTGASGPAMQSNETGGPSLHSGERINTTAVSLLFVDDVAVETSSISAEDFLLSDGDIATVHAESTDTNATVEIVLEEPIDADELAVGIRPSSDIQNVEGDVIDTENETTSVIIPGMDGIPPDVLGVDVSDARGKPARIAFTFDETITALEVDIRGPADATLGIEDFDKEGGSRYVTEYEPPEEGEYSVTLTRAEDDTGNEANFTIQRLFEATRPELSAVIGIDFAASEGLNVTFDAGQSAGSIVDYEWKFGDGTTATGERVSHVYDPGLYTVSLTVTDGFGSTETAQLELDLTDGIDVGGDGSTGDGGPTVIVDRDDPARPENTLVSVTGAVGGTSVSVDRPGRPSPLLVTRNFNLSGIEITPSSNASFSFALSATSIAAVAEAESDGSDPLGGFTVVTDVTDEALSTVNVSLTVTDDRLDILETSPEAIELSRYDDGNWEAIETTVVEEREEGYRIRAISPGFSRFAVLDTNASTANDSENGTDGEGTTDGTPSFAIVETRLSAETVTVDEPVRIQADVTNDGDAAGEFTARLGVNGSVVDTERLADVEAGETATVSFDYQFDEPGPKAIQVNDTDVGQLRVEAIEDADTDDDTDDTQNGEDTNQNTSGNGSGDEQPLGQVGNQSQFEVSDVELNTTSIDPGGGVIVSANVTNTGDESADFVAELLVDDTVVQTRDVPKVPGGEDIPISFTESFNETGTYNVSVSGTASQSQLTVGDDGGRLGFLGFLPLGLLGTFVTFVGIPLLVLFLVLKALAYYLGY